VFRIAGVIRIHDANISNLIPKLWPERVAHNGEKLNGIEEAEGIF
jgi:hypothetical protein